MARASCIYLVYDKDQLGPPIASFTVKYEAFWWCGRSGLDRDRVQIERQRDGLVEYGQKESVIVEWPTNS